MAANMLGTTGNWGIPQDEAGMLIIDLAFDFSIQEKPVLTRVGEVQGLSLFGEMAEGKAGALVASTGGFSEKVGAALTLANAFPAHLTETGGTTIITAISRTLNNEDFEKIDLSFKHYPFLVTGG